MKPDNKIMLITYPDSLGKNLTELRAALVKWFSKAIGGVHILPFFPSSADRGFAPARYDVVEPSFGSFDDVEAIGREFYLMFDFMVNHISSSSEFYKNFQQYGDDSPYKDMFIRYKNFWPGGEPTGEQIDLIYKRKPRAPYIDICFGDGHSEKLWCTFSDEQVDLNVTTPVTKQFFVDTLEHMCKRGASIIRLDAFAYAVKKIGTNCFFVKPEIWDLLREIENIVKPYGVEILPEVHEHYTIQHEISRQGFWIYDFALPVIVLYTLYSGNGEPLKNWLENSPKKQFTTLDTHDGIGIVDVKDLLSGEQIEYTKEKMFSQGANVKKIYNTAAYNNLDIYQINTTYYAALGKNDDSYLLSRAIQFFAPGIPQVYYVGMLAGDNDIQLMEQTKNGRDINRHYYTLPEIEQELERPVVQKLLDMMEFRNSHPAFSVEGTCEVELPKKNILVITRRDKEHFAILRADLITHKFTIEES